MSSSVHSSPVFLVTDSFLFVCVCLKWVSWWSAILKITEELKKYYQKYEVVLVFMLWSRPEVDPDQEKLQWKYTETLKD